MSNDQEEIVVLPGKREKTTIMRIERVRASFIESLDRSAILHEGRAQHSGIKILKPGVVPPNLPPSEDQGDVTLQFRCYLLHGATGKTSIENRMLRLWFNPSTLPADSRTPDRALCAHDFFRELVRSDAFPRDYVGFVKRCILLLRSATFEQRLVRAQVEFTPFEVPQQDLLVDTVLTKKPDSRPITDVSRELLLRTLEQAYPNVLSLDELISSAGMAGKGVEEATLRGELKKLCDQELITELTFETGDRKGQLGYRRKIATATAEEAPAVEMKVLDARSIQMELQKSSAAVGISAKPTIAIITAQYYEKLAIDAMMEHRQTFVRYKTEGESNVYTIGVIGPHRVVTTKLPMVGRERAAKISSANQTTRLCGIFQDIEHVVVMGVAGAIPHFTNFLKHSRRGDIVVSSPNPDGHIYIYCDNIISKAPEDANGAAGQPVDQQYKFTLKTWSAPNPNPLLDVVEQILDNYEQKPGDCEWTANLNKALEALKKSDAVKTLSFDRPSPDTDKLFVQISDTDVIEVQHPPVDPEMQHLYQANVPNVRLGCIGSGIPLMSNMQLRAEFASKHDLLAFDYEFDQVFDSLLGSKIASYICVRGINDYADGLSEFDWAPYSALAAAAFVRCIVLRTPPSDKVKPDVPKKPGLKPTPK